MLSQPAPWTSRPVPSTPKSFTVQPQHAPCPPDLQNPLRTDLGWTQVAIDSESVAKLNGCTLPNKARVWLEPELARCAAVDGDLMADYVKANGQVAWLSS